VAPVLEKKRLSFKDSHALKTLPGVMEKLTAEIEVLRKWLADPGLFARDPGGFNKRSALLVEKEAALAAAEEEWLRLELLREEAEGTPAA
jgi:ATP-binding cassette subfamily F protein uup